MILDRRLGGAGRDHGLRDLRFDFPRNVLVQRGQRHLMSREVFFRLFGEINLLGVFFEHLLQCGGCLFDVTLIVLGCRR